MARKPADLRSAMQAARGGGAPRRQAASQSEEAAPAAGQTEEARSTPRPGSRPRAIRISALGGPR